MSGQVSREADVRLRADEEEVRHQGGIEGEGMKKNGRAFTVLQVCHLRKETSKEGLGMRGLTLQLSSGKVSTRMMGSPRARAAP